MKSLMLSLGIFAAVIAATRAFSIDEAIDIFNQNTPENLEDQLENFEDKKDSENDSSGSNPHDCDCDGVCDVLHHSRLPKDVRVRINNRISFHIFFLFFAVQVKYLHIYAQICSTYKKISSSPNVELKLAE